VTPAPPAAATSAAPAPPAARVPLTVLVVTRNEEANLERCLLSVHGFADQLFVVDSESADRTVEIARRFADEVRELPYDHTRIIPWIFQWGLDHLPIRNDWVLILEADQALPPELRAEIAALLARPRIDEDGFYIRRKQIFRGQWIRFGGYGGKRLLKLFRRGGGELDPLEQDTRVYVHGRVGRLRAPLEEWNKKEDAILFYLQKHLRYADAFAREELERRRRDLAWKLTPRLFGTADERTLWLKARYYRLPLFVRPALYFFYRYFLLLGLLDGKNGFIFHFLQAFWFRLVVDVRLEELLRQPARPTGEEIEAADARGVNAATASPASDRGDPG
jgi:glycosyltransferase involved in cell wall biosynthesis